MSHMNKPTEKGSRKLAVTRQTAIYLFCGLVVTLFSSGYFKLEKDVCIHAYFLFVAALVSKDGVFAYGNAKEHQAEAGKSAAKTP